eukprot:GHRR01032482.1.p2 GENE.GHRR01032482.1~~GHRR01032482.1.p2  ORF type:complete len:155 (-),score=59.10 GHRR01032482.1:167-631(-)
MLYKQRHAAYCAGAVGELNACTASLQVDFLAFTGSALKMSNPTFAAVQGSNSLTMSTLMSTKNLFEGLLKHTPVAAETLAASIVSATYNIITRVAEVNAGAALSSNEHLYKLYTDVYSTLVALQSQGAGRRLSQDPGFLTIDQVSAVLHSVAKV